MYIFFNVGFFNSAIVIMIFCYYKIYATIRKVFTLNLNAMDDNKEEADEVVIAIALKRKRTQQQILKQFIVIIFFFLGCWTILGT